MKKPSAAEAEFLRSYKEIDGMRVCAVIRESARVYERSLGRIAAGSIIGLRAHLVDLSPVWLAEVIDHDMRRRLVHCAKIAGKGEWEAGTWYGPPVWGDIFNGPMGLPTDWLPCDYDVFGYPPLDVQTPPGWFHETYVMLPTIRTLVPPPFRRDSSWWMEAAIMSQAEKGQKL